MWVAAGGAAAVKVAEAFVLRVAEPLGGRRRVRGVRSAAIDRLLRTDMESQRLGTKIRSKQRALSREANSRTWSLYLEVEELSLRRSLRWIEIVARWAERRGARARARRGS
jgi:hypothetical protein